MSPFPSTSSWLSDAPTEGGLGRGAGARRALPPGGRQPGGQGGDGGRPSLCRLPQPGRGPQGRGARAAILAKLEAVLAHGSTLEVRPIFHHRDDTSIGHIVACFLALRLEV